MLFTRNFLKKIQRILISIFFLSYIYKIFGVGNQAPINILTGSAPGDEFGTSVNDAGDVDNDGVNDLIIGAPFADNNGTDSGNAVVISGQDGSTIYSLDGDSTGNLFGTAVSGAGDLNNDGFDDIIIGAPGDSILSGYARVFSGQTGLPLYTFDSSFAGDLFGSSVNGAGDINNDGFDDVIVGAPGDSTLAGYARVFSGQTGLPLYTFNTPSTGDLFGDSVSGAGDINNDGFDDIVVGAPGDSILSGYAYIFSGQTGLPLHTFNSTLAGDRFGDAVSGAGDINNDGFGDVIVGAPGDLILSGYAHVFSGRTGLPLYTFNGNFSGDNFGKAVNNAGDVNGDGMNDIIIGAPLELALSGIATSFVNVYSGQNGLLLENLSSNISGFGLSVSKTSDQNSSGFTDFVVGSPKDPQTGVDAGSAIVFQNSVMCTDVNTVSLSNGGIQTMTIDLGSAFAGQNYNVFGTGSGTSPGIPLPSIILPLNFDGYTLITTNMPSLFLTNSQGVLDAQGKATITFNLPTGGHSDLVGVVIHHAAVIGSPATRLYATNPVPLTFVP